LLAGPSNTGAARVNSRSDAASQGASQVNRHQFSVLRLEVARRNAPKSIGGRNARFAGKEPLGQQTLKAVRWGKRFFDTSRLASFFLLNEPERKERGR